MHIRRILPSALLLALGMACGPVFSDPPPWATAHGHRTQETHAGHSYVYYPADQVYYAPQRRTWYWLNGGSWHSGPALPAHFHVGPANSGVTVVLAANDPYLMHEYVERIYGSPWRAQNQHTYRNYQYVYYPHQRVYYSPSSGTWFWKAGDHWHFGNQLPHNFHLHPKHDGVRINLSTSRPYSEHYYVEDHYGKPWRARHRKDRDD